MNRIIELDEQLSDIENQLNQKCMEIPYAKNILAISGIGENTYDLQVFLGRIFFELTDKNGSLSN